MIQRCEESGELAHMPQFVQVISKSCMPVANVDSQGVQGGG